MRLGRRWIVVAIRFSQVHTVFADLGFDPPAVEVFFGFHLRYVQNST